MGIELSPTPIPAAVVHWRHNQILFESSAPMLTKAKRDHPSLRYAALGVAIGVQR
jgi:hypothetical protein